MATGKVIPNRFYRTPEGRTTGLCTSYIPPGSVLVSEGFSIAWPDGTTGIGRKAFTTAEEAQGWVDAHPNFPGMSQG